MKSGDYKVCRVLAAQPFEDSPLDLCPLIRHAIYLLLCLRVLFRCWMKSSSWINVPPLSWLNSTIWRRFPTRCVSSYKADNLIWADRGNRLDSTSPLSSVVLPPADWNFAFVELLEQSDNSAWRWIDEKFCNFLALRMFLPFEVFLYDVSENTQTHTLWPDQCEVLLWRSRAETDRGDPACCRHYCIGCQW